MPRPRHLTTGTYIVAVDKPPKYEHVIRVIQYLDAMPDGLKAQTITNLLVLIQKFGKDERLGILLHLTDTRFFSTRIHFGAEQELRSEWRRQLLQIIGIVGPAKDTDPVDVDESPTCEHVMQVIKCLSTVDDLNAQTVADLLILIKRFGTDERLRLLTSLGDTNFRGHYFERDLEQQLLEIIGIVWQPKKTDSSE